MLKIKIVLSLLMCFPCLCEAQSVQYGAIGGINYSWSYAPVSRLTFDPALGYTVGISLRIPVTTRADFTLLPAFSTVGSKNQLDYFNTQGKPVNEQVSFLSLNYLQMPSIFSFHFPQWNVAVRAGCSYSYLLSGTKSYSLYTNNKIETYKVSVFDTTQAPFNNDAARHHHFSIVAGIAYAIKGFPQNRTTVSVDYDYGLSSVFDNTRILNRCLSVKLCYLFN